MRRIYANPLSAPQSTIIFLIHALGMLYGFSECIRAQTAQPYFLLSRMNMSPITERMRKEIIRNSGLSSIY